MRLSLCFWPILALFLHSLLINAQNPKHLIGLQTGNHLSLFAGSETTKNYQGQFLLRYSIGIAARTILKDNMRGRMPGLLNIPMRKGVLTLDYGVNAVFNGYSYRFGEVEATTEAITFEFPLMIAIYDKRPVMWPRRWIRKGLTTFGRIGVKPTLMPGRVYEKERFTSSDRVTESIRSRRLGMLYTFGVGLIQTRKNGSIAFWEVAANMGLTRRFQGELLYENGNSGISQTHSFASFGSYISSSITYLFDRGSNPSRSKRRKAPIIYNPRLLD